MDVNFALFCFRLIKFLKLFSRCLIQLELDRSCQYGRIHTLAFLFVTPQYFREEKTENDIVFMENAYI